MSCAAGINLHFTSVEHCISSWLKSYGVEEKVTQSLWVLMWCYREFGKMGN
jgi:hypothetical protein